MTSLSILLCSDLDRTLLPNGPQPESPRARELFRILSLRPEITLAYVTGRHYRLLLDAIQTYELPVPDFAVADVGATIYRVHHGQWHMWEAWERQIAPDWNGWEHDRLASLLDDIDELKLQEPEKQNRYKLSYYARENIDHRTLRKRMHDRLESEGIKASLIWSVDEAMHRGLMDILPERATKYHAVRFIMEQKGIPERHTVFAGDSGNDLPALTNGLQAVLVRNAGDDVRTEALREMQATGRTERLYLSEGGFLGMNGNYAAGVLEGLVHYIPQTADWLNPFSGADERT